MPAKKGVDPLINNPVAFQKRQDIWMHNGLLGQARRADQFLVSVVTSRTTTDESRAIAQRMMQDCTALRASLKERRS